MNAPSYKWFKLLLWRGSLLPLDCAAVAKPANEFGLENCGAWDGAAAQPNGSKLPRHKGDSQAPVV
ncbi:hypothetical protein FEM54_27500 [Pseudomonas edaphica]|uniref:Secreted protein n=1 Tax=Pseudomonas edaphica TaxID=2006980 RepID=A0ABY2TXW6_9PSED|nr:hypothetical protein FEM54_27500 [Pseudomonas edaphica]